MRVISAIKSLIAFIRKWLWKEPTTPIPEERFRLKAREINLKNVYTVIEYKGQKINLNKQQLAAFHKMNRGAKRKVLEHWKNLEKKGHIRFQEIDGQLVAIKNKDYESKADIRQLHFDKAGQR